MDMVPFLRLIPSLKEMGYGLVCKLHTKRGVEPLGAVWREHLLETLVGSAATVRDLIEAFNRDPWLGLAGPAALYLSAHTTMYENRPMLEQLASAMEQPPKLRGDWGFFAGSMGWVRLDALMPLATAMIKTSASSRPLELCLSNADGGWPHAVERAMGSIGTASCVAILGMSPSQAELSTSTTAPTLQILSSNERKRNIYSHHAGKRLREIHTAKNQRHDGIHAQSRL